jgi:hypothetical protein
MRAYLMLTPALGSVTSDLAVDIYETTDPHTFPFLSFLLIEIPTIFRH